MSCQDVERHPVALHERETRSAVTEARLLFRFAGSVRLDATSTAEVNGRSILLWLILPPVLLTVVHLGSDLVAVVSLVLFGRSCLSADSSVPCFWCWPSRACC